MEENVILPLLIVLRSQVYMSADGRRQRLVYTDDSQEVAYMEKVDALG